MAGQLRDAPWLVMQLLFGSGRLRDDPKECLRRKTAIIALLFLSNWKSTIMRITANKNRARDSVFPIFRTVNENVVVVPENNMCLPRQIVQL